MGDPRKDRGRLGPVVDRVERHHRVAASLPVGDLVEEGLKAALARSREVSKQIPDVRWIRSYYSAAEGKLYCEYEAPSLDLL